MNREQPKNPPPAIKKWSDEKQARTIGGTQVVIQERRYRLITPLFGGGVEPGVNDPDNLIRATEIRGQLRFWWRAIRGGNSEFEGKIEKMKAREDEIWGAASKTKKQGREEEAKRKSAEEKVWNAAVQIVVENVRSGQEIAPYEIVDKNGHLQSIPTHKIPAYVAFPLQPERNTLDRATSRDEVEVKTVRNNVSFTLKVSFAERWEREVEAAFWAWETFGGLGARTRRGAGALQLIGGDNLKDTEIAPADSHAAEVWLKNKVRWMSAGEQFPKNVPHLSPDMDICVLGPADRPASIWERLIDKLNNFRQQRETYIDKKGKKKVSPNRWPEAQAIRKRILGRVRGKSSNTPDKFPRAIFGLPIVFHFIREPGLDDVTLQGKSEKRDRFSSPLILRPLCCGEDKALGLAAVLKGWSFPIDGVKLVPKKGLPSSVELSQMQLTSEEIRRLELRYIPREETDLLQAFINYLKSGEKR